MGTITKLKLTDAQVGQPESGFLNGRSHCFRVRCRSVLFKANGLSSSKAREHTDLSLVSVHAWVNCFLSEGTRPVRGRKPIMDSSGETTVRAAIEQDRQPVGKVKATWREVVGKEASMRSCKSLNVRKVKGIYPSTMLMGATSVPMDTFLTVGSCPERRCASHPKEPQGSTSSV